METGKKVKLSGVAGYIQTAFILKENLKTTNPLVKAPGTSKTETNFTADTNKSQKKLTKMEEKIQLRMKKETSQSNDLT
jgi:hypothetical protein